MSISWEPNNQVCVIDSIRWAVKEVFNKQNCDERIQQQCQNERATYPSNYFECHSIVSPHFCYEGDFIIVAYGHQ